MGELPGACRWWSCLQKAPGSPSFATVLRTLSPSMQGALRTLEKKQVKVEEINKVSVTRRYQVSTL